MSERLYRLRKSLDMVRQLLAVKGRTDSVVLSGLKHAIEKRRAEQKEAKEFGYLDLGGDCGFDAAEDWIVFGGLDRLAYLGDTDPCGA